MAAGALSGQVAIVTGAGKGIGKAIALELAAAGARVLLTGRSEAPLGEAVGEIAYAGGQARHLAGDVRDAAHVSAAVARAVETWGRLDLAVANAGTTTSVPAGAALAGGEAMARVRDVIETNLFGTLHLFDAAAAAMSGPGRLVAISSVLGKFGVAGQSAYCASKAGVHGLVRALAVELAGRGVTCNAVCPGWVDTEMARERIARIAAETGRSPDQACRETVEAVPVGRFVDAHEVAKLVVFLCSPAAASITGQALSICGGTTPFAG